VRGIADLVELKSMEHAGIEGVISGRAIYDGRLDPAAALALLRKQKKT
jgi:phosphoribosylformimino-5-aminoimidazole carboxamide ribotide isomerase